MSRSLVRARRRKSSALLPESLYDGLMRFVRQAMGGFVMLVAAAVAVSLFSYAPHDPSLNTSVAGVSQTDIHNLCGLWGAYGADFIWQFFGLGGFVLPVIIAAWGWRIATEGRLEMFGWRCLSTFGAMIIFSIALGTLGLPAARDGAAGHLVGGYLAS